MRKKVSPFTIVVVALTIVLSLTARSHAGYVYDGGSCTQGYVVGQCEGNFSYFRNRPDNTSYAYFGLTSDGVLYFHAALNNVSAGCLAPSTWSSSLAAAALATRGYFYVQWNSAGVCTFLSFSNGSHLSNW